MSAPPATRQPAPRSALRRLVARHPVAAFLVMAYTFICLVALPPVRAHTDILPFDKPFWESLSSIFGVALPAFLVVAAAHGRVGVRDLARRSLRWRVGLRWYLGALFGVPVATLLCASVLFGLAPLNALMEKWELLFTAVLPQLLLSIVFFNLAEEIGFMGFLQASLQEGYGPLKASLIVTVPFALWHLPSVMVDGGLGFAQLHIALAYLGVLAVLQLFGRVVMMWLYNSTGYSVLLVGLFHSSFDATTAQNGFAGEFIPEPAATGLLIPSAVVAVAAVFIVVLTKGRLSYRPDRTPQPAAATP
jgi:membrane protease YdiL (CAAX protease family)